MKKRTIHLLQNRAFLFVANGIEKVRGTYLTELDKLKKLFGTKQQPEDAPPEETQPEPLDEEQGQLTTA